MEGHPTRLRPTVGSTQQEKRANGILACFSLLFSWAQQQEQPPENGSPQTVLPLQVRFELDSVGVQELQGYGPTDEALERKTSFSSGQESHSYCNIRRAIA
jgi:hypothetical protein